MVEGISKVVFSLSVRLLPMWGWVLASGVLGVLIAFYLLGNSTLSLVPDFPDARGFHDPMKCDNLSSSIT